MKGLSSPSPSENAPTPPGCEGASNYRRPVLHVPGTSDAHAPLNNNPANWFWSCFYCCGLRTTHKINHAHVSPASAPALPTPRHAENDPNDTARVTITSHDIHHTKCPTPLQYLSSARSPETNPGALPLHTLLAYPCIIVIYIVCIKFIFVFPATCALFLTR